LEVAEYRAARRKMGLAVFFVKRNYSDLDFLKWLTHAHCRNKGFYVIQSGWPDVFFTPSPFAGEGWGEGVCQRTVPYFRLAGGGSAATHFSCFAKKSKLKKATAETQPCGCPLTGRQKRETKTNRYAQTFFVSDPFLPTRQRQRLKRRKTKAATPYPLQIT